MEKIVVVIMGQDCERFLPMALESVKEADDVVFLDGGSRDDTQKIFEKAGLNHFLVHEYDQKDKQMNGKQRNIYLDYVKDNYPDWWCLVLDADEVVEDFSKIKEFIQMTQPGLFSVKMRHFEGDLGHEDTSVPEHYALNRLFKISEAGMYPLQEHPVLQPKDKETLMSNYRNTTIWHLAYTQGIFDVKKRYENHLKKSQIHSEEYLRNWYKAHLFGVFPKQPINLEEVPPIIFKHFKIDPDEIYFANRGLEIKHFLEAIQWKEYFEIDSVTLYGCGRGPRVLALNSMGLDAIGIEKSKYAVEKSFDPKNTEVGDITKDVYVSDLVIAYDVLEHLDKDQLKKAIDVLYESTNEHLLVSVPFAGTPNCENDPTHKIKEEKEWWIEQFKRKGFKLKKTPENFLFHDQILIFGKEVK